MIIDEERPELGLPRNLHDKALGGAQVGCLLVVNIVLYSKKIMISSDD